MSEDPNQQLNKLPFLFCDALLLGVATFVATQGIHQRSLGELCLVVGAVVVGAAIAIAPFLIEYIALTRLAETELLGATVRQLNNLEAIARNVTAATAQWQGVQSMAAQTNKVSKEIADQMTKEVAGFTDFLQKANDSERTHLRLEVEKLRRVEGEWLQVVVGILDHVSALNRAAAQSGQPALVQQLGAFQHACRDIARRVGISHLETKVGEVFDAERHRLPQPDAESPDEAVVEEVLAPGVAFQGRLLRPSIVTVKTVSAPETPELPAPVAEAPAETGGEKAASGEGQAALL